MFLFALARRLVLWRRKVLSSRPLLASAVFACLLVGKCLETVDLVCLLLCINGSAAWSHPRVLFGHDIELDRHRHLNKLPLCSSHKTIDMEFIGQSRLSDVAIRYDGGGGRDSFGEWSQLGGSPAIASASRSFFTAYAITSPTSMSSSRSSTKRKDSSMASFAR